MSVNLVDTIQANLNYPPLQKIDPNTQEEKATAAAPFGHRFSQAAIPAVLTGLYKYTTTDEGAETVLRGDISTDWVSTMFGDTREEVVQKINTYSSELNDDTTSRMNDIANEAIRVIRENIKPGGSMMDVKNFMSGQRNTILLYLPAALHMGEFLRDDTLDDNTHKMEGPISSLMHKIGSAFSKPANEEEARSNQ
ncbi:MAG: hypothetical protein JWP81_1455 [Ferruginibacter sp.]|nr:hypothetical protein [Ferruginibacter sp.]